LKIGLIGLVEEEKPIQQACALITSIPGVGKVTAYQILGMIPAIEGFSCAKAFAAFIGLTPQQKESGQFRGKSRLAKLGNTRLRKAFYMASLSAKRYNPRLSTWVKGLQEAGKPPKVILCAVMRKLAHWVFGVLKHQKAFSLDGSFGKPING
jgi:transposase